MHWDESLHAGFTTGTPWLPVNENHVSINAQQALADDDSVFYHYQKLVQLRRESEYRDVIVYGQHQLMDHDDTSVYAYLRYSTDKTLLIIANFTGQEQQRSYRGKLIKTVLNNYSSVLDKLEDITLQPYQAIVVEVER
jgi:oligo-1,6-glucosidase